MVNAIHEVTTGQRYLGPPLPDRLIDAYIRKVEVEALDPYKTLLGLFYCTDIDFIYLPFSCFGWYI